MDGGSLRFRFRHHAFVSSLGSRLLDFMLNAFWDPSSQPMASLQVRDDAGVWRYVKHQPGNMVINAGEFMNWYTGGYFKVSA